jgi:hypothetical protein
MRADQFMLSSTCARVTSEIALPDEKTAREVRMFFQNNTTFSTVYHVDEHVVISNNEYTTVEVMEEVIRETMQEYYEAVK